MKLLGMYLTALCPRPICACAALRVMTCWKSGRPRCETDGS